VIIVNADEGGPGYAVVDPDDAEDHYADSDVPGEFRSLTASLGCRQLAVTLIRVPPHSDFEQGTGHFHEDIEELYLLASGTLTMRFGDDIRTVSAPAAVRVASTTPRSHRNESDGTVELWAVSRRVARSESTKIDDFWAASSEAAQHRD
jgi:mannose-6-phosphate isomerase-like protein (cupin superfamily)